MRNSRRTVPWLPAAFALLATAFPATADEPVDEPLPNPLPAGPVGVTPVPSSPPVPAPGTPAPGKHGRHLQTGNAAGPEAPVTAEFEYAEQWKEGPFQVIFLTGGVTIVKGGDTLQADSVIGWAAAPAEAGAAPAADLDVVKRLDQVYAEGNVRFSRPGRGTTMADRVYMDFRRQEGVFLDFRIRMREPRSNQAMVIRAAEARQVAEDFFVAQSASITTCTYGTPHYDIVVRRLEFSRHPDSGRGVVGVEDLLVRVDGTPIGYWPALSFDLDEPLPLRRVAGGNTSRFGPTVLTRWGLPITLEKTDETGQPKKGRGGRPERDKWGDVTLDVDFRDKRGWGVGPDLKYKWHDEYEGFLDTYYMLDRGRNMSNTFDQDLELASPLRNEDRGHVHDFHRHQLSETWRLDTEVNYISDRDFLFEFFPREQREEKQPESYVSLRGLYDNWGLVLLERNTLNDWQSQVEYMPHVSVAGIAQPVWPEVLPGLLFFTTTQADDVRWHQDFQAPPGAVPDDRIWRLDSANELWYTLHLGPLNLAPFAGARWSAFQETLDGGGYQDRFIGTAGARAEIQAHRVYPLDWDWAGMHNLRHVVSAEGRWTHNYTCTVPSRDLIAFDEVESADKFEEVALRLNQRFQTQVGPEGKREVVDFLWLHTACELYPDAARDTTVPRPQNTLAPFHWITLPLGSPGLDTPERRYSNLFVTALLAPRSALNIRLDEEYDLLNRRPAATETTAQVDVTSWMRLSAGYYMSHDVTETVRATALLHPTPRISFYAMYAYDILTRENTGMRFAAQWDLHDLYLDVLVNIDPIRDEKQYLAGVTPKFGKMRSLFPRDEEVKGGPLGGTPTPVGGATR
jgi:hypothetical protein